MLKNFLDFFTHHNHKINDEMRKKHRFFLMSLLTTFILSIFYVYFFKYIEYIIGVYIVSGYIICHILFFYLSKIGKSLYLIGNLFAAMTYIGFCYSAATTGGVSSAVIAWLLSTKISSFWYADRKSGYFWSILTILTITTLLIFEIMGRDFPILYDIAYKPYFSGTMHIGVLIYYVIVIKVYEDWKDESIKKQKEKSDEKEKLIKAIAHDLRTPLQVLEIKTKIMQKNATENPGLLKDIELLQKQTKKLIHITDELISSAKKTKTQKIYMHHFFKQLTQIEYAQLAKQKDISFEVQIENKNCFVIYQKITLERIIQNLISNALKYSPSNTKIILQCEENEECTIINIKDEGLGLSQDEMARIFNPHAKISNQPTAGEDSIGIGLAVTKMLAQQMDSTLTVQSEGKNQGSTFSLTIPKPL